MIFSTVEGKICYIYIIYIYIIHINIDISEEILYLSERRLFK